MRGLAPLVPLFEATRGAAQPLPRALARLYGPLRLVRGAPGPLVLANFASTLDGVVALKLGTPTGGGGEITGFDPQDRLVMGLLRAVADAVVVGAGTLRSVPRHRWTPEGIFPELGPEYRVLRRRLGKSESPLNAFVTGSGDVDLTLPVFRSGEVDALVVTTAAGARRVHRSTVPSSTRVQVASRTHRVSARAAVSAVRRARSVKTILVEGGPRLMGDFLREGLVDELFLTLAPQVAGREEHDERPAFVSGVRFAPRRPLWSRLADARRGRRCLFLRYSGFRARTPPSGGGP